MKSKPKTPVKPKRKSVRDIKLSKNNLEESMVTETERQLIGTIDDHLPFDISRTTRNNNMRSRVTEMSVAKTSKALNT